MEFDFIDHQLVIRTSDGDHRLLPLRPRSVAEFYADVMHTLEQMGLPVKIWSMPVEIPAPIRFEEDVVHHDYDPECGEPGVAHPRFRSRGCSPARGAGSSASAARSSSSGAVSILR